MKRGLHESAGERDGDVDDIPEPANLRFLRRLVTLLMVTMIVGISVIAGSLALRLMGGRDAVPFTEIAVDPAYEVKSADHGKADRLVLVLRHRETGIETVRVYRTEGQSPEGYTIRPE